MKKWKFDKSYNFYQDLAMRESTDITDRENPDTHYIGLYQMGESALVEAKFYNEKPLKVGRKAGTQYNNDWSGTWTKKAQEYGINSKKDFLNNREVQEIAVREYHHKVWKYIGSYQKYEGQIIAGIKLTKQGMIAASHLIGTGKLKEFIDSKGRVNESDKFGTTCSEYLEGFSDSEYTIDFSKETIHKMIEDYKKSIILEDSSITNTSQAEGDTQEKAEKMKLEQELGLAELECKTASEEWNEWSNGIGKGVSQDDPEHISRDEKCQATFKKVRSLKQKLNGNATEQTEKVEQAKLERVKQEEVKQKAEANKKAAEEIAKQQEQKSARAEAKEKQEESKKAEQEQVNQNQTAEQQQSQDQSDTKQINADQSQNTSSNANTDDKAGNTKIANQEVTKQHEQGSEGQASNGELTEFVLTKEEEATIERTMSEKSAAEAKAREEQKDNEAVAVLRQQKENQALHNSVERDQLERSGVKLSAHDKIADSNPNTEATKLDHIEHDYIEQQNQQPGSALGNLSSVNESTEVNKSLSYSSVGIKTSSGIGIIKGSDSSNKASVNTGNDTGYFSPGSNGAEGKVLSKEVCKFLK